MMGTDKEPGCKCDCRKNHALAPTVTTREVTNYYLCMAFDKKGELIGWRCKRCGHIQSEIPKDAIEQSDGFYKSFFPKSFRPTPLVCKLTKAV